MTSQTGQQIITTHVLPNIFRIKSNQAMKFDHLIKHSARNILHQNLCRKQGTETSTRSFFFNKAL